MKAKEIQIGGKYLAKVSGRVVPVVVDGVRERFDHKDRSRTVYDVTSLRTGRKLTFRSPTRFRGILAMPERTV